MTALGIADVETISAAAGHHQIEAAHGLAFDGERMTARQRRDPGAIDHGPAPLADRARARTVGDARRWLRRRRWRRGNTGGRPRAGLPGRPPAAGPVRP